MLKNAASFILRTNLNCFSFMCLCVDVHISVYTCVCTGVSGNQTRVLDPLELQEFVSWDQKSGLNDWAPGSHN